MEVINEAARLYDEKLVLKKKQVEALLHLTNRKGDLIVSLPVGYGESIIYHLLPRVLGNSKNNSKKPVVLVISPLNIIQDDQRLSLERHNISCCTLDICANVDGSFDDEDDVSSTAANCSCQTEVNLEHVKRGKYSIILCHPEALLNTSRGKDLLRSELQDHVVAVVIDECHIIEKWSLDAHTFFVSDWVKTIRHMKTATGNSDFRADVKPSWRVTEEPHHPWVTLKKSGPIINVHCDCMAGLGETCSHIGALLFKMEAAVRLGYTASACTDIPCAWNACFVKDVNPCEISNIKFYKAESKDKLKKSKKKLKTAPVISTVNEQNQFLDSLASLSDNCVGLSLFNEYADRFVTVGPAPSTKLPPTLRNLYCNSNEILHGQELIDMCDSLFNKIQVDEQEIRYIEEATRNQSTSSVWLDQRYGCITASVVGDVLRTDPTNPAPSPIKKICIPRITTLNTPAIQWDNDHEEDAFRLYTNIYANGGSKPDIGPSGQVYVKIRCGHKDSAVNKSGLLIDREFPCIGASPDGVVTCYCCGTGELEIKCPYKLREVSLIDALKDKTLHLDGNFNLKRDNKFYAQVQTRMYVANASFADFVTWTPLDCSIVRVKRDEQFIKDLSCKIPEFWKANILPELITCRLELKQELPVIACENKENHPIKTFCLCKTTTEEYEMVACDRCDQWFHPGCLGLKKHPSAKIWYCPECKNDRKVKPI